MKFTNRHSKEFTSEVIFSNLQGEILRDAILWITSNLTPDEVFDSDQLESWAIENNFIKTKW